MYDNYSYLYLNFHPFYLALNVKQTRLESNSVIPITYLRPTLESDECFVLFYKLPNDRCSVALVFKGSTNEEDLEFRCEER